MFKNRRYTNENRDTDLAMLLVLLLFALIAVVIVTFPGMALAEVAKQVIFMTPLR